MDFARHSLLRKSHRMKHLLSSRKSRSIIVSEEPQPEAPVMPIDQISQLVTAKEETSRHWESQEEMFFRQRREYLDKMVDLERTEIEQREADLCSRNKALEEKKLSNSRAREDFLEKIRSMQEKLDSIKLEHKAEEDAMAEAIAGMESKISDLKTSLEQRRQWKKESDDRAAEAMVDTSGIFEARPAETPSSEYPTLPAHDDDL